MIYGDKRDYRKIHFYDKKTGKYLSTTSWSRTCKEALQHIKKYKNLDIDLNTIRASYK